MRKRILIIDDDPDILELLKIVFRDSGLDVIFSPIELDVEYISLIHPDLVLLDVRIIGADRSGAEICRELKANPITENVPVILCSAENNLRQIASDCKADTYISKPFDLSDLLSQVNKFLS